MTKIKSFGLQTCPEPTVHVDEPKYKPIPQTEGERYLCLYRNEWIVLEVGHETPAYEESFEPFYCWFEPFNEMLDLEYYDIADWQELPPIPTEQAGEL